MEATGFLTRSDKLKLDKDATLHVTLNPVSAKSDPDQAAGQRAEAGARAQRHAGAERLRPCADRLLRRQTQAHPRNREDPWQK